MPKSFKLSSTPADRCSVMGNIRARRKISASALSSLKSLHGAHRGVQTDYTTFDQIDGTHPWQKAVPEGYLLYPVRRLHFGKVVYFNFELAKEMGLIDKNHSQTLNPLLENKILDAFNLRIINEFDQKNSIRYHPAIVKKNKYMATRYLQLQHADKKGRTSGDGRSIWNGVVRHKGRVWDVSSRGTGVTALSPGAVEAGKPLKSGVTTFGYGCGMADIDELVGAAIMAETFHHQGIGTERVLTIIDHGDGNGIGVRVGENLIRPAHLFIHLKQENYSALQRSTDYLIERQVQNREWQINLQSKKKYETMLDIVATSFAQFTARLDRDYIFAWMDWDGDNVLANAGIIDYGSIRQFGLRHDEYRYDDVTRFSTNLNEQRDKARMIVQVFAQMTDYLVTKTKKPLHDFAKCAAVKLYERELEASLIKNFLRQMGLTPAQEKQVLTHSPNLVKKTYFAYTRLERMKTRKRRKVADGVNRPAILDMRKILGVLPEIYQVRVAEKKAPALTSKEFFDLALAKTARSFDRKLTSQRRDAVDTFQAAYIQLLERCVKSRESELKNFSDRSAQMGPKNRITGDALLYVVDEILKSFKKLGNKRTIQVAIDRLIADQTNDKKAFQTAIPEKAEELFRTCLRLIDGHKESI